MKIILLSLLFPLFLQAQSDRRQLDSVNNVLKELGFDTNNPEQYFIDREKDLRALDSLKKEIAKIDRDLYNLLLEIQLRKDISKLRNEPDTILKRYPVIDSLLTEKFVKKAL